MWHSENPGDGWPVPVPEWCLGPLRGAGGLTQRKAPKSGRQPDLISGVQLSTNSQMLLMICAEEGIQMEEVNMEAGKSRQQNI